MTARTAGSYQIISQAEGIINYTTSRSIEGVTKFSSLRGMIRELRELFETGSRVEQVRICGTTDEGHQYLTRILLDEICFGININLDSAKNGADKALEGSV
jgi:hypothetical protein